MELLVGILALLFSFCVVCNAECGGYDCKYTCWTMNPNGDRFAACTGTDLAPQYAVSGHFVQEVCGGCAQNSDRVKGYWPADDNSWCWVALSDLSDPYSCEPEVQKRASLSSQGLLPGQRKEFPRSCPTSGCYTPITEAMVRGDVGNNGCECHHFLAWMFNGQHIQIGGPCDSSCYWVYGEGYGEVNEQTSVIASEIEYTSSSC